MFEKIYEIIFNPNTDAGNNTYQTWIEKGYEVGGLILIFTSLIVCSIFYLVFGNISPKHATINKWLISMLISGLTIFLLSVFIIGTKVFNHKSFSEIPSEIWLFSTYNMIYGVVFYILPLSFLIKYFSRYSKYTPF